MLSNADPDGEDAIGARQFDQQQQDQQQEEQKKDQADGNDDGSVDAALGLINSGPVQLKNDLEQPVTSGGMDSMIENPGIPD
ncbi:MAG: hypothetical protein HOQ20_21690, partial [Bradyrhizobium sp.]|nr:hypothetical protein [Bradyrhizobium sp.]